MNGWMIGLIAAGAVGLLAVAWRSPRKGRGDATGDGGGWSDSSSTIAADSDASDTAPGEACDAGDSDGAGSDGGDCGGGDGGGGGD